MHTGSFSLHLPYSLSAAVKIHFAFSPWVPVLEAAEWPGEQQAVQALRQANYALSQHATLHINSHLTHLIQAPGYPR